MKVARSRPFLVACALLVVGGLFAPWTQLPGGRSLVLFGALDKLPDAERSGWEALAWLDVALVLVAVVVVAAAFVRAARVPAAVLGPALCLIGLVLALFALLRRRTL